MVAPLTLDFWGHAKSHTWKLKYQEAESFKWDSKILPDGQETELQPAVCWHQGWCGSQVRQLCTPVTKLSFLPESCWSVPVLSHSTWRELNMSLAPFFSNVNKDIQNFIRLIIRATVFCVPQIEPTVSAYLYRAYLCRAYFCRAYVRVDHIIGNDSKTLEF